MLQSRPMSVGSVRAFISFFRDDSTSIAPLLAPPRQSPLFAGPLGTTAVRELLGARFNSRWYTHRIGSSMGADPLQRTKTVSAAVIIVALVVLIYYIACKLGRRKEGFVSERAREVCAQSREVFRRKNDANYSDFKTRVSGADAVMYTDVRKLWQDGKLSPESVQKTL